MEICSTIAAISWLLLIYCALKAVEMVWWRPLKVEKQLKRQGIKGNRYKLLFGDGEEVLKSFMEALSKPLDLHHRICPRVLPQYTVLVKRFGNVSVTWAGMTPRLVIKDPELIKEVLANKSGQFLMLPLNPFQKLLAQGVSSVEGDRWVQHRNILNPAFHLTKLKGMVPAFGASCSEMVHKWEVLVSRNGFCELDIWTELKAMTGDAISRTAFGSNYDEGKRLFEYQKEQIDLMIQSLRFPYIPGFRFVPTRSNRRMYHLDKEIKAIINALIHKKEQSMKEGDCAGEDLLGLMLKSNNDIELSKDSKLKGLTIEEIIEECKLFYFAGHATTTVLLTWTMVALSMHPFWQDQAREEVLRICGSEMPSFESLNQLKIVTMILHEVLRLYPPAIAQYRHVCEDAKLGELSIPAGTNLVLTTVLVHHDTEIWGDDAEEFKPERFSEGLLKATNNKFSFFPFGWGPRTCIGQNYAMIEVKIALSMILQHFSFELSPTYVHAPCNHITLQPQHGAQLIIRRV